MFEGFWLRVKGGGGGHIIELVFVGKCFKGGYFPGFSLFSGSCCCGF